MAVLFVSAFRKDPKKPEEVGRDMAMSRLPAYTT